MKDVRNNLRTMYAYKFLSEFWLIAPILIPYYVDSGLSPTQVFTVQAFYALAVLLLEIPSGYLADVVGRKATLLLGAVFLPVGVAVYVSWRTFPAFLMAEGLIALANSMRSGCDSAMVYDTLSQLGHESDYKKCEGRMVFFTRLGTASSAVIGGLAASRIISLPFFLNIASSLPMLPLALTLVEPERRQRRSAHPLRDIVRIAVNALGRPQTRHLMMLWALIVSSEITALWAYFLYYQSLKIPIGLFGVLFAVFQLASAIGSHQAHRLEKLLGHRRSWLLLMLLGPSLLLLGGVGTIWLLPLIFFNSALWGFSQPLIFDRLNRLATSDVRATVLSTANMTGSLGFALISPLFGALTGWQSLGVAFIFLGGYFLIGGAAVIRLILTNRHECN